MPQKYADVLPLDDVIAYLDARPAAGAEPPARHGSARARRPLTATERQPVSPSPTTGWRAVLTVPDCATALY